MKQLSIPVLGLILIMSLHAFSQANNNKTKSGNSATNTNLPYTASLSSQAEIGNAEYAKMMLTLYKDYETNQFSHGDWVADTITAFFSDGTVIKGKDKVIERFQNNRNNLADVKFVLHVWMPVKLRDRNEDWVLIWDSSNIALKDGTKLTFHAHEAWQINKDGKVSMFRQYELKDAPPAN